MRTELRKFRVGEHLTQAEMADRCGCTRVTYQAIETGRRNGSMRFVTNLQKAFNLSWDNAMELMKTDEDREENCSTAD